MLRKANHIIKSVLDCWACLRPNTKTYFVIAVLCVAFIGFGYRIIEYEYYAYAFIPLALLGLLFIKYQFSRTLYLIALVTPFSIDFTFKDVEFTLSLPTEPIMILMMLMFFWSLMFEGHYSKKYIRHPITITILINLLWMFICAIFSTDPLVSFKYILARMWFVVPCFFIAVVFFNSVKRIRTFLICYLLSLFAVIVYSTINFLFSGFELQSAHFVMQPFYNDHTAYGAIVALMLPVTLYFSFGKGVCGKWQRLFFILLSTSLLLALILSYARAAWLSVIVAFAVYVFVRLKIRLKSLALFSVLIGLLLVIGWQPLMQQLEKNAQDSSGNIMKHITSMSNISTDASNVERLNRWSCALRMWQERPVTGFGPGTYQFQYASYQKSYQKTWISTNFGTLGNAHSEYLGPLSEMGVFGSLSVLLIFGTTVFFGIATYRRESTTNEGKLSLFLTISLITYYTHGFMNNFLDSDKLSVPFWAFTAAIAALSIASKRRINNLDCM